MWDEGVEALSRVECLQLLAEVKLGRVGVSIGALPAILPVNYVLLGEDIVFRTGTGTKLNAALMGTVVAFEIDAADSNCGKAWSVLVVGRSEPIRDPATLDQVARLSLASWAPGPHDHVVRISAHDITGRRFDYAGQENPSKRRSTGSLRGF